MKNNVLTLIKSWLLHFSALIFLVNFYDSIDFIVKTSRFGAFRYDQDFKRETVLQRLIRHTIHNPEIFEFLAFTLLVELLYHFVFKRFKWFAFILSVAVCCFVVFFIHKLLTGRMGQGDVEPISVLIGYAIGYALLREFFHHKLYLLKVRLGKSQTELQVLKQQLDPHFLFNTLNYLYGTALRENAERTAEGIDVMSGMMRYTVSGLQESFVPLADEVNFIDQYIYLQRVRLPETSTRGIKFNMDVGNKQFTIAPMLFIPFIENAFKHGISADEPVDIAVEINQTGPELTVRITTKILHGNTLKGTNAGLLLSKRRLNLLYAEKHKLTIEDTGSVYQVTLNLTLAPLK